MFDSKHLAWLSLVVSIVALGAPIYFQYFWHSEKLVIHISSSQYRHNNLETTLVMSNLGNRDEVLYKVSSAYYDDAGYLKLGAFENEEPFIIKKGESMFITIKDLISGILRSNPQHEIYLYLELMSQEGNTLISYACIDNENNEINYLNLKLDLYSNNSIPSNPCDFGHGSLISHEN
ncbi:hypothetical protein R7Q48_06640 [Vibrio sp. 378]|uniref:hypothetical protein n=1 Tax=Vibrio sp. 378 TaxID=3074603 RepID=UPI00296534D4|nr:hypothetical protein [Vibrio sp. 378]MDW2146272.1 hypothetical protein [Vibrio sp. 378]